MAAASGYIPRTWPRTWLTRRTPTTRSDGRSPRSLSAAPSVTACRPPSSRHVRTSPESRMRDRVRRPYGRAVVTVSELQASVASSYERLGLPSWPNPHPRMVSPREEEYSRVTDPERYRIVHARAGVWTAVLKEALGVRSETLAPGSVAAPGGPEAFDRGVRLIPRQPGTLPLLLLERDVPTQMGDATMAVLHIGVVRPDVVVEESSRTAGATPATPGPATCWKPSTRRSVAWLVVRSSCCGANSGMRSGTRRAGARASQDAGRTSAR